MTIAWFIFAVGVGYLLGTLIRQAICSARGRHTWQEIGDGWRCRVCGTWCDEEI